MVAGDTMLQIIWHNTTRHNVTCLQLADVTLLDCTILLVLILLLTFESYAILLLNKLITDVMGQIYTNEIPKGKKGVKNEKPMRK